MKKYEYLAWPPDFATRTEPLPENALEQAQAYFYQQGCDIGNISAWRVGDSEQIGGYRSPREVPQ